MRADSEGPQPAPASDGAIGRPLLMAAVVTVASTGASRALPPTWQALGVAAVFLGAAYFLVVRGDDNARIRAYGLSLGGVVEAVPLELSRVGRAASGALGWASLTVLLAFPPFWLGFLWWWGPPGGFAPSIAPELASEALGQLLVIALPEEAFYRGYLQTELDRAMPPRAQVLGARVGWAIPVTSLLFALGHLATELNPTRLAVFFPSLVFGWLRARSGGIGAPLAFHAACNLFAAFLARGYGLAA